jgi:L-lactate dehydrogenase complex protein LldE
VEADYPARESLELMRVALFITCFNDTLFPATGKAVVELLERLGCEVGFPEEQTCCGQMHANSGYQLEAIPLARRFVRVFGDAEAVVSPSASCVGMVREQYGRLAELAGDPGLAREVAALVGRVHELTEFLVDHLGVTDVGATFPHRVTLHPTCHSLRLLRVGDRPRRLLEAVRGIDLVDLEDAGECCGFGGTFAVKNADTSMAMLGDKLRRVLDTRAEVCTAADNSCLMHIGGALRRQRAGVRTMHLAEILAAQE